jgi:broad specificity phosphatase PhoE
MRSLVKRFYIVRHGSTDWVEKKIIQGISDIPLNENGLRQARQAAKVLFSTNAKNLYTSPLKRCQQTADMIGNELNLIPNVIFGFEEIDFGWLEGRPYRDHVKQKYNFLVRFWDMIIRRFIRYISGESSEKFRHRILSAWEKIISSDIESPIIVVGHGLAINKILINLFGEAITNGQEYYPLSPGSITEILINDLGEAELVRLDDKVHTENEKY